MSSGSRRLSASSSVSRANASGTLSLRFLRGPWPIALPMIDFRSNTCAPMPGISNGMCRRFVDLDLDLGLVEAAVGEALAEALRGSPRSSPCRSSASSSLSIAASSARGADLGAAPLALEPDRFLDQVAGDLLDVAADIADLGELGRLDLDERRVGELRQPAADLGLAAAGGADHQDVLGRDLVAQLGRELLAAPAVAQARRRPPSWRRPGRRYAR